MRRQHINSYAKQVLKEAGLRIIQGKQEILHEKVPKYEFRKRALPHFFIGEEFINKVDTKIIKDYSDIRSRGLGVSSFRFSDEGRIPWRKNQRVFYRIVPDDGRYKMLDGFPIDHYAQEDVANGSIRLVGPSAGPRGLSDWVVMKREQRKVKRERTMNDLLKRPKKVIQDYMTRVTGIAPPPNKVEIRELPFMITNNNEVVCLDQSLDEPRIGCFGTTGSGKSYAMHALMDMAYHHPLWKRRVAVINDIQSECGTWVYPNTNRGDIEVLNKVGLQPRPLPMVYLHPTLEDAYERLHAGTVGFDISLPYKTIINRFGDFFKLEGSEKYFKDMKTELLGCKSKEDLYNLTSKYRDILPRGTINKINSTLGNIFKLKIMDVSTDVPSSWTIKDLAGEKSYNPLTACIRAGVIPCFETQTLTSYDYFPQYYKYFVGDVFNRQNNDPDFRKNQFRIWLYVDEVLNVAATDNKSVAETLLTRTVTEGRIRRIGTILATQNFRKLPERIRSNIKTIITFNNPQEAGLIVRQYNMPSHFKKTIKELEKFEMLAYTTDYFIVYDNEGNKFKAKGPFVGRSLPPMSLHKKPLAKGKEYGDEEYEQEGDGEWMKKMMD